MNKKDAYMKRNCGGYKMIYPCEEEEDNLEQNRIMSQSGIVWTSQSSKAIAERDKNKDNKNNNVYNEFTYKPKTNVKEKDKEFIAKAIKEKIESNKVINNESKPLNILARQNQATYNAHTKLTQSKSANLLTSNVVSMNSAVTYIEEIQESKKDLQRMVDRMY